MTIAAGSTPNTILDRVLKRLAGAADRGETPATLNLQEVEELARDCGISIDQLMQLAKAGPHAADEMIAMMRALNIDSTEVRVADPTTFHTMQSNCASCTSKGRCRSDLAKGTAIGNFIDYCNNIDALTEMRARPELLRD